MRIELPLPAWAETALRADEDAHTLTVAPAVAAHWAGWQWPAGFAPSLKCEVPAARPAPVTLTL